MATTHVVAQGECLSSIAARYGLKGARDLHEHPDNAGLKRARPNPNVLAPGDEVVVPDAPAKWVARTTEKRHRFVVPTGTVLLRVQLRDARGASCGGKRFVVTVGARDVEGTTTQDGVVEAEVPVTATRARLRAWLSDDDVPTLDRQLLLGHLDPDDTVHGVQARLANLGYACPVDGAAPECADDPTLAAVRAFRAASDLPEVPAPEGDDDDLLAKYVAALLDDDFRAKLAGEYARKDAAP